MKYYELDQEEKKILKDVESGKYVKVANQKEEIKRLQQIARATLNKTKNINIRLTEKDLRQVKSKAMNVGIPYQTLLGSLIHQYADEQIQISI